MDKLISSGNHLFPRDSIMLRSHLGRNVRSRLPYQLNVSNGGILHQAILDKRISIEPPGLFQDALRKPKQVANIETPIPRMVRHLSFPSQSGPEVRAGEPLW